MRRVPFCPRKKEPKTRRGSGADELQAPRARFRSKRPHPRTPFFTGEQDRVMHHPLSGVEVSRHSKPLFSATALLAVVEFCRAFRARLLPAGSKTRRSAGGRRQCCFGTHQRQRRWGCSVSQLPQRRSMSGMRRRAGQRFSLAVRHRFFWQDKRNGVGKIRSQGRQPLAFGLFWQDKRNRAGKTTPSHD